MTDDELTAFATEFRDEILGGRDSRLMCAAVSWPLAGILSMYGVEARARESHLGDCNHVWLELPDGRVLDPTADQFNDQLPVPMPPVYLGPPTAIHVTTPRPAASGSASMPEAIGTTAPTRQ